MEPYKIIYQQLGGSKFTAMTGATVMCSGANKLVAKIKGSKKCNYLSVELNVWDTYDVVFKKVGRAPKYEVTLVSELSGVYAEDLKRVIEDTTGLYLSL
jgi:hypothetical protein